MTSFSMTLSWHSWKGRAMSNLYRGKQRCAGCGRTGEECPRFEKDGLCYNCAEKLQLGREVSAQLATEYSEVRFPELSTVHMTWYEIPFIQDAFKNFINRMTEFSTKFASKYGKTPLDDFVLGRADCGTSSDVFVMPTEAVEPLKELCHALQDKMWEVRLKEDNMRAELGKELDAERNRIYNEGVERGRDLLRQLNDGEIGLNDFKARQKYEKPKN